MDFAKKLNELMNETDMTNYRLAKLLNVHQTTISNWRTGKTEPKVQTVKRIAKILDTNASNFLN